MPAPPPWSDQPITTSGQDCFGRSDYAKRAADLIVDSRSEDASAVFGLTGPWGSGKTSMIEMMLERLRADHPEWRVARFTPWSSADVPGLLSEFYASLLAAMPPDRGIAVRQSLATLLQIAAPAAKLIPLAGDAASGAMVMAGQALAESAPWDAAFANATQKLRETDVPLLVVADDVDRLQADELVALLKVVRLLGRFPGVQYLLAYDDRTLTRTLSTAWGAEDGGVAARSFMEKIVQYPLLVPPLLDHQLVGRFDAGVDRVLHETGRPPMESCRLGELVDILPALLPTPRAVDRLLAQLGHHLVLLDPEEINDEDVILLTLVRTAFPRLYDALPHRKTSLISGHSGEIDFSSPSFQWTPARWDQLFQTETVPAAAQDDARRLLAELFPKAFAGKYSIMREGERRICDENYFDRYFAMSILSSDVSDAQVLDVLSEAKEGRGDALTALLTEGAGSRTALTIGKAARLVAFSTSVERFSVVSVLSGSLDRLDENHHVLVSNRGRAIRWMAEILALLDRDALAAGILGALSSAPFVAQLQVWERVIDRVSADMTRPAWVAEVSQHMGDAAIDKLVGHLRRRDEASPDELPAYYVHCALKFGMGDRLRDEVEATLRSTEATLEDLAARMVPTRWLMGVDAPPALGHADQRLWSAVAPDADDSWYLRAPDESVDCDDLSWANRRRLARGRFERPSREAVEGGPDAALAD